MHLSRLLVRRKRTRSRALGSHSKHNQHQLRPSADLGRIHSQVKISRRPTGHHLSLPTTTAPRLLQAAYSAVSENSQTATKRLLDQHHKPTRRPRPTRIAYLVSSRIVHQRRSSGPHPSLTKATRLMAVCSSDLILHDPIRSKAACSLQAKAKHLSHHQANRSRLVNQMAPVARYKRLRSLLHYSPPQTQASQRMVRRRTSSVVETQSNNPANQVPACSVSGKRSSNRHPRQASNLARRWVRVKTRV